MKAVMISIRPKWCELIAIGKKTIEVRKTMPKIDVPFKCYIYKTKKRILRCVIRKGEENWYGDIADETEIISCPDIDGGNVIGEFVCDNVDKANSCCVPHAAENNLGYEKFIDNGVYKVDTHGMFEDSAVVFERQDSHTDTMLKNDDLESMSFTPQELFDYIGGFGKPMFLCHITSLLIYDKPKELGEFKGFCEKNHECYSDWVRHCNDIHFSWKCNELTKPPRLWCYVEELKSV